MLFERANSLENKKPPVYPEVFYFTLLKQNLFCQSLKGTEAKTAWAFSASVVALSGIERLLLVLIYKSKRSG
jgi:hypothetical protein